ncbi:unnamed protein product [Owenia fusiformis]|uniref:Uncharacterized protein n=1 Tax=Owenia fusiformis TaxID=6347 RepID=A0A8J1UUG3_OWEFU|nr:unnamed protein product [Owenia fusiformis]
MTSKMDNGNEKEEIGSVNRVVSMLDELEKRVEALRKQAQYIEEEKEQLLSTLNNVQHSTWVADMGSVERSEIEANAERLVCRCLTVEVSVSTPRNTVQETALKKVNGILDQLHEQLKQGVAESVHRVKTYLNSCANESEKVGPVDRNFEGVLIDCTADDQKKIKGRLQAWLHGLEQAHVKLI